MMRATVLNDVLTHGLDVVFCGTAPSEASAAAGAYYARPGNKFWPILCEIGLTPHQLQPADCWSVNQYKVGLTDLAKHKSGSDSSLAAHDFSAPRLKSVIRQYNPKVLAFTSKRAATEGLGRNVDFGLQEETLGSTRVFVLNSTSGRAAGHWQNGRHWHALAEFVRSL
jgi:double-stranded uracil-DNA glycosylase